MSADPLERCLEGEPELVVPRPLWHKACVSVFLERFVLPIFATVVVLIAVTNPMGFDNTQRITGALALIFAAYFAAHTVTKLASKQITPSSTAPGPSPASSTTNAAPFSSVPQKADSQPTKSKPESRKSESEQP